MDTIETCSNRAIVSNHPVHTCNETANWFRVLFRKELWINSVMDRECQLNYFACCCGCWRCCCCCCCCWGCCTRCCCGCCGCPCIKLSMNKCFEERVCKLPHIVAIQTDKLIKRGRFYQNIHTTLFSNKARLQWMLWRPLAWCIGRALRRRQVPLARCI